MEDNKTYTQDELDQAIAGAKSRWEKKLERDYIAKSEYDNLKSQLDNANLQIRVPKIKERYLNAGGNELAFNDFIKLNDNLLGIEDQQTLDNAFNECISKQSYMFKPKKVNVNTPNSETHIENEQFIKGTLFRR